MSVDAEIISIVQDIARPRHGIEPSTRIYQDLWIAGDDAFELLERIHQKFGTSFEGFRFDEYFPNETAALFSTLAMRIGFDSKKALTVQDLIDAVEAGRWADR